MALKAIPYLLALTLSAGFFSSPAPAEETLEAPTLEDYLRSDEFGDFALSPDGKKIALLQRIAREQHRLIVLDVDNNFAPLSAVRNSNDGDFRTVDWLSNERIGVGVMDDTHWVGYEVHYRRMMTVNADGSDMALMFGQDRKMKNDFDLGRIASRLPNDLDHILLYGEKTGKPSVFKVNIFTGKARTATKGSEDTIYFRFDLDGNPTLRLDWTFKNRKAHLYTSRGGKNDWKRARSFVPPYDDFNWDKLFARHENEDSIFTLERKDDDEFVRLWRYNTTQDQFTDVIYETEKFDLYTTYRDPWTEELTAASWFDDRMRTWFVDDELNALQKKFEQQFTEGAVTIDTVSRDGNRMLLQAHKPWSPPMLYFYEKSTGRLIELADFGPHLKGAPPTATQIIKYQSTDGMTIHGYVTYPRDSVNKPLPLIIYPHDGPRHRVALGYDPLVQYWATRGYMVFEPNFRGSFGFGREFEEAGYREYGGKMIDDILAGVDALKQDGRVDPDRVCAVGRGYGGYAALMLSIRYEGLACAVSINGISDWQDYIEEGIARYKGEARSELRKWYAKTIGDPDKDDALLASWSPLLHAEDIEAPVLLIHSRYYNPVRMSQGHNMAKALERQGKEVELFGIDAEGHMPWRDTRETGLKKAVQFVDHHLN